MNCRSKCWCFTRFSEDEPLCEFKDTYQYLIYGRETCPQTNRRHQQGFVAFKIRTRFSTVQTRLPGCHIERMRGSIQEAVDYCKKDGDFSEFGELPNNVKSGDLFKAVVDLAECGKLDDIKRDYPGYFLRYKATLSSMLKFDIEELDCSCGVWISGPPRSGKDYAVSKLEDVYVKNINKWWDGYRNEKYVFISDMEPKQMEFMTYFLKIWTDRYPFNAEVKGGSMKIRPKKIYVTSNFKLEECAQERYLDALRARFNCYHFHDVTGYVYIPRNEAACSDRVLKALKKHEPEYSDVSLEPLNAFPWLHHQVI